MFTHAFTYRGRDFAVRQTQEGELALMLGKVVRKTCPPSDREPQYLWTNVELEWEEHHYIEARYWAASGRLRITANGGTLHDGAVVGTEQVVPRSPMQDRTPSFRDAEAALRNLLRTGALQALPTHPHVLDTLLALATGGLARKRAYAEWEVNETLSAWLESVHAKVDHVTLRRRMVDLGFLKRTKDGSRYFLNFGRVNGVLGDGALVIDVGAMVDEIVREREARKNAYGLRG